MVLFIELEVKAEGPFQTAAVAALTENKRLAFSHAGELWEMKGFGKGFTIMEAVAALVQLKAEPMTVYCVLPTGESVNELPTEESVDEACQVKLVAPAATSVPVSSGQIETLLTLNVGLGTKLTAMLCVLKQELASKLVTVYT